MEAFLRADWAAPLGTMISELMVKPCPPVGKIFNFAIRIRTDVSPEVSENMDSCEVVRN